MQEYSDETILVYLSNEAQFEKGFRLLMHKYQKPLYGHIRSMLNSHGDTDDVIQNTFIKVYRYIGKFEKKSSLYTWLYRIATNETISFLKKKNRNAAVSIDDEQVNIANTLHSSGNTNGDLIQQKLQAAIAQLPEKQRQVFNLRYYDELPYQAISERLDTSVGALKANYHHAVKKITAMVTAM